MASYVWLAFLLCFHFANGIVCPDKTANCPPYATCCVLHNGAYGCCPYKNAQCCSDKIHCCPEGTKCNMERQSCDSTFNGIPLKWMVPLYDQNKMSKAFSESTNNLVVTDPDTLRDSCPDGNICPDKNTCCRMSQGSYGCCPFQNAVCCSDNLHCCPAGYKCDVPHQKCLPNRSSMFELGPKAAPIFNIAKDAFEVPREEWCFPVNKCSLKGHVCCKGVESIYCCPSGSSCSTNPGLCTTDLKVETNSLPDEEITSFLDLKTKTELTDVVCPDQTESCPAHNTCCLMAGGSYGCCPLPQATCCPDLLHCCPYGYTCDGDGCARSPWTTFTPKVRLVHPLF